MEFDEFVEAQLAAVREWVRLGTRPTRGRANDDVFLRRRLAIAASTLVVAVVAGAIAVVHARSAATPLRRRRHRSWAGPVGS
ncbi:hypothetical protein ABIB25_001227 [Nakamurella sp. UYEF19]